MTDKQIIIDGVDVSRCESFCNGICCKVGFGDDASCKLFSGCNYKQLKRLENEYEGFAVKYTDMEIALHDKEQECKELKQGYAELTEIVSPYMGDFTGYNEELGGFDIVLCVKELMEQLDQLKASLDEKNDLLQKLGISASGEFHRIKYYIDKLVAENEELKVYKSITPLKVKMLVKTLTEIKEIVQFGYRPYKLCGEYNDCCDVLSKIWNKISEVTND